VLTPGTATRLLETPAVPATPSVAGGADRLANSVRQVAVVGASGALGFGLAVRLGRAGTPVVIGSREPARAAATVERARCAAPRGVFSGRDNASAVRAASAVILSVPFHSQPEVLRGLREALRPGQLLIDATVPLAAAVNGPPTRTLGLWQGSAAQQALELVPPGVRVVSALHTVSAGLLGNLSHSLDQDVLLCGDAHADKREAARLLERIDGLRCVDCGPLEMARVTESLTPLLIAVKSHHGVHPGIRLTGLPPALWE
jgi:8-hydroxy-5-deazaflavin:NADPH oxidoreductase